MVRSAVVHQRVLVVSASMGAGHDGAAGELARRLEAEGHAVRVVDFLHALPARLGPGLRSFYRFQIRYLPNSYERTYHLWFKAPWMWKPFVRLEHALAGERIMAWIDDFAPDVVVSVYPFSSLVLGELRGRGAITVPVVTFLTDFAVHPRWIHPDIDLHLAVHPQVAIDATERSKGPALAPGPLVRPVFSEPLPDRQVARATLGIPADARVVLVVAGSWAVGNVEETVETIARSGRYLPVTLCGSATALRNRLAAKGLGLPVGWTDQVPCYLAAADVLVENAGGLSFLEACAAGLPVVTYDPIAGHGRDNARCMARAGVAYVPATPEELLAALDELSVPGLARDELLARARSMFTGDAAREVVQVAIGHQERKGAAPLVPSSAPAAAPPPPERRGRLRIKTLRPGLAQLLTAGGWALAATGALAVLNDLAEAAGRWFPS